LGRVQVDRHGIRGNHWKLDGNGRFESFIPERQAVAVPVEQLEAVTALAFAPTGRGSA
jgi:hypothetical protein